MNITFRGKRLTIRKKNGKFIKPNIAQFTTKGRGGVWFDDCRIPYTNESDKEKTKVGHTTPIFKTYIKGDVNRNIENENPTQIDAKPHPTGRFPANLLVSDDALNDGKTRNDKPHFSNNKVRGGYSGGYNAYAHYIQTDSGSFSRYFDLDKWAETQFIITPKPSRSEKEKGLENFESKKVNDGREKDNDTAFQRGKTLRKNTHPTVKPIKLFSYLITMISRKGDVILDPFMGSGTSGISAKMLDREYIGIEKEPEWYEIAKTRIENHDGKKDEGLEKFV